MAFGAPDVIRDAARVNEIRQFYPEAAVFGCSTSGEISGARVLEDSFVVTAIHFEKTLLRVVDVNLTQIRDSFQAGQQLAGLLPRLVHDASGTEQHLSHVLVLTDGLDLNGSDLTSGLTAQLPAGVAVTGGLAGDGTNFKETLVFREDQPSKHTVSALGLYGSHLKIGFGSMGGWDPFGPERMVTKSKKNVLYELDGKPALALYKQYLGEHANKLPSSGLFFPLCIRPPDDANAVVRTFLTFSEEEQSMTFSGNIAQGSYARLMKANASRLVDGATGAALNCNGSGAELAILVSCVARKLVLKQRTEEEVEAVSHVFGPNTVLTGFYSYGEIAPFAAGSRCELHNQTMTITTLSET